jgi:transcriptional regulator with XRE-family HTH domain
MVIGMAETKILGVRLKCLRQKKGLTQAELASLMRVSRETVKDWERSRYEPSCKVLVELSILYQVSTDYLLGIENPRIIRIEHLSDDQVEAVNRLVLSMEKENSQVRTLSDNLHQC